MPFKSSTSTEGAEGAATPRLMMPLNSSEYSYALDDAATATVGNICLSLR